MYYGRFDDYDDETTSEQWEKIAKLAAKGDSDKLMEHLSTPFHRSTRGPRAFSCLRILNTRELAKSVAEAKGSGERAGELCSRIGVCLSLGIGSRPRNRQQALWRHRATRLPSCEAKPEYARMALVHVQRHRATLPAIVRNGTSRRRRDAHWPPVHDSVSPALHDELHRLRLSTEAIDPWRFFEPMAMPVKKSKARRVSPCSFDGQ